MNNNSLSFNISQVRGLKIRGIIYHIFKRYFSFFLSIVGSRNTFLIFPPIFFLYINEPGNGKPLVLNYYFGGLFYDSNAKSYAIAMNEVTMKYGKAAKEETGEDNVNMQYMKI